MEVYQIVKVCLCLWVQWSSVPSVWLVMCVCSCPVGVVVTGHAALDVRGREAVVTVETSDAPYGMLSIAPASRSVAVAERDGTVQIFVNREFGSSGQWRSVRRLSSGADLICRSLSNDRRVVFLFCCYLALSCCYFMSEEELNIRRYQQDGCSRSERVLLSLSQSGDALCVCVFRSGEHQLRDRAGISPGPDQGGGGPGRARPGLPVSLRLGHHAGRTDLRSHRRHHPGCEDPASRLAVLLTWALWGGMLGGIHHFMF